MKIAVTAEELRAPGEWNGVDKPIPARGFLTRLSQIAADSGRSRSSLLKEIITLKLGDGRLSMEEYAGLRLYDRNLYGDADKKAFVGFKSAQKIWLRVNYRFDFYGLVNNKIASDILFGTYGLPIMPTVAIFREQVGRPSSFLLRDEHELRAFLTNSAHYPLFGKPMNGHQSLGTVSLERYDAMQRRILSTIGQVIPLDTFLSFAMAHAVSGYIFQKRVSPQAQVREICKDRLATVRLLTAMRNGKPEILRACWKIPAGMNVADNFWRHGNLLAQLDIENGRVLRVVQSGKAGFEEIMHHPDTEVRIPGIVVPNWREVTRLAIEGAQVMEEMALIGWDIAPVDSGAVIVECNETPDFKLHQLADRRGMMDDAFRSFLEERKKHAADWLHKLRQKKKIITELVPSASASSGSAQKSAP